LEQEDTATDSPTSPSTHAKLQVQVANRYTSSNQCIQASEATILVRDNKRSTMFAQDYLSFAPESLFSTGARDNTTNPPSHARKTSAASNGSLRDFLGPCYAPPGCRTVSFSSWNRITTTPSSPAPTGALKASDLCQDRGTSAFYDPPASEWCYLGADQQTDNPKLERLRQNILLRRQAKPPRHRGSNSSWKTVSEQGEEDARSEPIQFTKHPLKRVNTRSQLTRSLSVVMGNEEKMMTLVGRLGLEGMTCEELPSAFDSDD
jgi:hypothetical protein